MALHVIEQLQRINKSIGQGGEPCERWISPMVLLARGFSMIEMMIALFILTVSILGLTTLTVTSIQANHQNDLRNTAIKLTSETAEILLARPIDNIVSGGLTPYDATNPALGGAGRFTDFPNPVQKIKGGSVLYTVTWSTQSMSGDLTQVNITVSYTYRGQLYANNAVIYKHRAI